MVSTSMAALRSAGLADEVGGQGGDAVDQMDDHLSVLRPAPGGADHGAVQLAARLEDAGGIDQNDLGLAVQGDPAHGEPRGLDLLGDD